MKIITIFVTVTKRYFFVIKQLVKKEILCKASSLFQLNELGSN